MFEDNEEATIWLAMFFIFMFMLFGIELLTK